MPKVDYIIEELVTANRILAREGVVDSFVHVSSRHPDNLHRYLLSRSRAPAQVAGAAAPLRYRPHRCPFQ